MPPRIRQLPNPGKAPALRQLNLRDFTSGLLVPATGDKADIRPNAVRQALNVDFDVSGGISRRPAMTSYASKSSHQMSSGNYGGIKYAAGWGYMLSAHNTDIIYKTPTATSWTTATTDTVYGSQLERGAQFGSYFYIPHRVVSQVVSAPIRLSSAIASTVMSMTNPTFQDSFASPSGTYIPNAYQYVAHGGYLWAIRTYDAAGAAEAPLRIRWSHPADGGSWRTNDYIDITDGSLSATAVSFGSHLLIATTKGLWAIYGSSPENFSLIQLVRNKSLTLIAEGGGKAVFAERKHDETVDGVARIMLYDGQSLTDISHQIRGLEYPKITPLAGAIGGLREQFIWMPVSYTTGGVTSYFVLKYSFETGSWTQYQYGDGSVRPFFIATENSTVYKIHCAMDNTGTTTSWWHHAEDFDAVADTLRNTTTNIAGSFTLPWIDEGQPAVKKTWKRPEILYRASGSSTFTVTSYVDYVDTADKTMTTSNAGSGSDYEVDKLTSLGPARAVSLKVAGPTSQNVTWSIDNITLKYRPKPLRN